MISCKDQKKKCIDNSSAVSEVIGGILLISVVVLAIAIIAAGLFSQPLPQKIPNVRFLSQVNGSKVTIYHDGGESLYRGEFYVKIDDTPYKDIAPIGSNVWDVGKTIELSTSSSNPNIQIFYVTGTGDVLLDQERVQPVQNFVPDVYIPPVPLCPACNTSNCTNLQIRDAYTQIVTGNSSTFVRTDTGTSLNIGGVLTFKVTNTSSTLSTFQNGNSVLTPLYVGDIVTITLVSSSSKDFKAFGLGDKFYHLRGDNVDIKVSNATSNINFGTVILQNGWITGYVDLGSTFTINSPGSQNPKYYTLLVINGTNIINSGNNKQDIIISKIRPLGVGLFLLEQDSNAQEGVNFVGYAETITVDGVIQH
jgi:hypothetical protein